MTLDGPISGVGGSVSAEGRAEGARELILAVFRLAVADHLGVSYGHDQPVRQRRVRPVHRNDAAAFLQSPWAAGLADVIGLSAPAIWREARRLQSDHGRSERSAERRRRAA